METVSERVEIEMAAAASGVPLVRHALRGLLTGLGVPDDVIADITLAVTEACTNAVVHAYPNGGGTINVTASHLGGELEVAVRDHGGGMAPRVDTPGLGVGLPVIAAIARSVVIGSPEDGGTEVRMQFALRTAVG
jgi:anti-sigma regulatory factor (Ser/Thr protein kinase)